MILRHVLRPRAIVDIESAFEYYFQKAGIELALQFVDAINETLQILAANPSLGSPRGWINPRLAQLRSWHVTGFNKYRVYYVVTQEEIDIVRILHGAQDSSTLIQGEQ